MKIVVLPRRLMSAVACAAAAAAMFLLVSHPNAVGAAASKRALPIYAVQTEEKKVALTFDAAWGNEDTQALIDILGRHGVKATFFLVGSWVDKYPESVKALSDAGHSVQNHSNTHPHMTELGPDAIAAEANACNDKIEAITGLRPTLLRPPYGDYNDTVVNTIRSLGMEPIQWDTDSLDWKDLEAQEITKRVLEKVQPGSIVLFHNAALHTPEALPGIIQALQDQGYTLCTVNELIYPQPYTIDHAGKQIPGAQQ